MNDAIRTASPGVDDARRRHWTHGRCTSLHPGTGRATSFVQVGCLEIYSVETGETRQTTSDQLGDVTALDVPMGSVQWWVQVFCKTLWHLEVVGATPSVPERFKSFCQFLAQTQKVTERRQTSSVRNHDWIACHPASTMRVAYTFCVRDQCDTAAPMISKQPPKILRR